MKGTNFVNLRDAGDPVEVARRYEKEGADELVFLDITASYEKRDIILDVVRRTAEQVFMPLTVEVSVLLKMSGSLSAGCDKVLINSAACKDPEFVRQAAERFGSQCIVVNIDPKRVYRDGKEHWEVHIMADELQLDLKPLSGRPPSKNWVPARSSSPAWMWMELVMVTISPITSAVSRRLHPRGGEWGSRLTSAPGRCNSTGKSGCRTRGEYFSLRTILNRRNKLIMREAGIPVRL